MGTYCFDLRLIDLGPLFPEKKNYDVKQRFGVYG
jgi:hypothetical protein